MKTCDCGNPLEFEGNRCEWCLIYDVRLAEYGELSDDQKHDYAETRFAGNSVCTKCGQFPNADGPLPCSGIKY